MYFYSVSIEMLAVGAGASVDKAWAKYRFIVLIYGRRLALCIICTPTPPDTVLLERSEKPASSPSRMIISVTFYVTENIYNLWRQ